MSEETDPWFFAATSEMIPVEALAHYFDFWPDAFA
jgi:hypothetical protein